MQAFPATELEEAWRLLQRGAYAQALELYEKLLRGFPTEIRALLDFLPNLNAHKALLKQRVFQQILEQTDHGRGFYVNFSDYCFLGRGTRNIFVSPKAIAAIQTYKGSCWSIASLKAEAAGASGKVLDNIVSSPYAAAMLYTAHSVSADIVDLCLLGATRPVNRVADYGAGAGLQAASLAVMMPQIQQMNLYEQQDFMIESIADVFAANHINHARINAPLDGPVDLFYSMRACTYLFSIDAYYDGIYANRSPQAWAMFDIGGQCNAAHETARLQSLFAQTHTLYNFGKAPDQYVRTVFTEPTPRAG